MASSASKVHLLGKKHSYCLCCQHEEPRVALGFLTCRTGILASLLPTVQPGRTRIFQSWPWLLKAHVVIPTFVRLLTPCSSGFQSQASNRDCHNREHLPQPDRVWPLPALNSPRGFCAWQQAPAPHPSDTWKCCWLIRTADKLRAAPIRWAGERLQLTPGLCFEIVDLIFTGKKKTIQKHPLTHTLGINSHSSSPFPRGVCWLLWVRVRVG